MLILALILVLFTMAVVDHEMDKDLKERNERYRVR